MPRTSLRLRPPPLESTQHLAWLLEAAFADHPPPSPPASEQPVLVALAERLSLAERIWSRHKRRLEADPRLREIATGLRQAHARAVAFSALYDGVAVKVAETARGASIPVIFLKGYALVASGRVARGRRPFSDLDVLVRTEDASRLHRRLRRRGFLEQAPRGNEQHLASLEPPGSGTVDIHFSLHGLVLDGSRWATAADAERLALLEPLTHLAGDCFVPAPGLMAAHLLAHGLAQHIWLPDQYPLLRLVGDMIDLLPDEDAWAAFLADFEKALWVSIHHRDLAAFRELTRDLGRGRSIPLDSPSPQRAEALLRHMLTGALAPDYVRSLKPRHAFSRLLAARRQGKLLGYLRRKFSRLAPLQRPTEPRLGGRHRSEHETTDSVE